MTASENQRNQLAALIETGSLPKSACGAGLLKLLRPLLEGDVVVEDRAGGGRRLVVRNPAALLEFYRRKFPGAAAFAGAGTRLQGVAQFRDSKSFGSDTPQIISLRAWNEEALLREGHPAGAAALTARHGVFSFLLDERGAYALRGPCALVENPAVFTHFERLRLPVELAIYAHGRVSRRLLNWLAGITAPDFTLLHLPDYDPVGLNEYERLRRQLGPRVQLYVPPDLADALRPLLQPRPAGPLQHPRLVGKFKNPRLRRNPPRPGPHPPPQRRFGAGSAAALARSFLSTFNPQPLIFPKIAGLFWLRRWFAPGRRF